MKAGYNLLGDIIYLLTFYEISTALCYRGKVWFMFEYNSFHEACPSMAKIEN